MDAHLHAALAAIDPALAAHAAARWPHMDAAERGARSWCYSCDGICEGHYTGKLTAVADENEEIVHWATSEAAAKRWLLRHR